LEAKRLEEHFWFRNDSGTRILLWNWKLFPLSGWKTTEQDRSVY
jgi:hypothetical protein